MPDNTYWASNRTGLLLLVEQLEPDDALAIIHRLVLSEAEENMAPALAALIRAYVARRNNEKRGESNAS